jgi:hypothetical protein
MNAGQHLTIPDSLIKRIQRLAKRQERQVDDVVAEALQRGLPLLEEAVVPSDWEPELAAFRKMHSSWREQFAGQYVAVYGGQLVDHDASFPLLLGRVSELYPDEFVLIRLVQEEPEIIYDHRSVRWVASS